MIESLRLRVASQDTLRFYTDLLGFESRDGSLHTLGEQKAGLKFEIGAASAPYKNEPNFGYWKIGLTTDNVDSAYNFLTDQGWEVSEPSQFRDIGYLCHLRDPDGLSIELLQHDFGKPSTSSGQRPALLLAHVTLRIADPKASLEFYQSLGLKLLSIQPVDPYGFTLYFLADTEESPPDPNLYAVSNRPWLWRRPYPVLELQHRWDSRVEPAQVPELGYVHLAFEGGSQEICDPDGHALWLPKLE
jgi:catechol 2,3-dioxygenase-like lactoylglutathione lyase family enzyme